MEPQEAPEVRLSDVCRACLLKTNNMTNFTEKNDTTTEIIAMLSSIGTFEIEINEFLPSYLCKTCEEKLRLSYEFQLLVRRSNEIIQECMAGMDEEQEKCERVRVVENPTNKRQRNLSEFSPDEVEEAINELRERFYLNIECIKCGFVTNNSRSLSIHMSHLHKDMKDRWCSFCNTEVEDLSAHVLTHPEEHFKCRFCGRKFNQRGHFYEHLKTHSSAKPYTCGICRKGFIARRRLDKHLRIHNNNRLYKCPICPGNFSDQRSLQSHLDNHSRNNVAVPDISEIKRPLPQNFCKICKKRVRSLDEHLEKVHNPNRPDMKKSTAKKPTEGVLCTQCGKKFTSFSRFQLHMRTHTGETPYKCQYCDKRTMSRNHLVLHERTHTGERPYVCNICGRGFSQSSVLHTHMKIHTGRPEVCDICKKRFCRPAQLRLHMRKHTGEKPYQCNQCEQAFKQQSHLSEHLKRHSDERPYQCHHCEKNFKQLSILKSHLTIHTGEKPFKCSQCPYACRQRHSLTQHMKQHSVDAPDPRKPHFCELCQKGYSTMAMLMSHHDLVHTSLKIQS